MEEARPLLPAKAMADQLKELVLGGRLRRRVRLMIQILHFPE